MENTTIGVGSLIFKFSRAQEISSVRSEFLIALSDDRPDQLVVGWSGMPGLDHVSLRQRLKKTKDNDIKGSKDIIDNRKELLSKKKTTTKSDQTNAAGWWDGLECRAYVTSANYYGGEACDAAS